MPLLDPELIDLLESSEDDSPQFRSISIDADLVEEPDQEYFDNDESVSNQDLHEEDYDGYAPTPVNETNLEDEKVEAGKLPFDDFSDKNPTSRRKAFIELLKSMEASQDIKFLYPASLSPKMQHEGYDEKQILREFVKTSSIHSSGRSSTNHSDFEELEVQNFVIYRDIDRSKGFNGQMEYLHNVASNVHYDKFLFDGTICSDGATRRVIGLEITELDFGGLDDISIHTTVNQIWIQTYQSNRRNGTWYRLCTPATEYQSYLEASTWVADFMKHVLDYLCEASKKDIQIGLADFCRNFWEQIQAWHGYSETFKTWHELCGNVTDFRKLLIRHGAFCWNQTCSVQEQEDFDYVLDHPVWDDIALADRFDQKNASRGENTIVTESIAAAFLEAFPTWGPKKYNLLSPTSMSPDIAAAQEKRRDFLGMRKGQPSFYTQEPGYSIRNRKVSEVEMKLERAARADQSTILPAAELLGKVVVARLDGSAPSGQARSPTERFSFAWISEIVTQKKLHAVWLSLPTETMCGRPNDERSFYPVGNELFFTESCEVITLSKVVGVFEGTVFCRERETGDTILVRQLYKFDEDAFITAEEDKLVCLCRDATLSTLRQPNPKTEQHVKQEIPKMKGLSLFCGAGLFDSALEESGTLETVMAIDNGEKPVRSHAANTTNGVCNHIIDSVNPVLKRCLRGKQGLPMLNCILAGCPCQGFSRANSHRYTKNAQRNCSMLANTLSWIDLVRPEYAIIENVPSMDHAPAKVGIANACSQAICCLVAMGYQVRKLILEAPDYGNSTTRRRLFLVAAAPKYTLPEVPTATHGKSPGLEPIRNIRNTFVQLPEVHNDAQVNLRHPDHLPIERLKQQFGLKPGKFDGSIPPISLRNVVQQIPKIAGKGLANAYRQGLLSKAQQRWCERACSAEQRGERSLSLRRITADGLLPTIVTVISPMCARIGGHIVHYAEDRTVTVQELRLAQGIPDWFLLVGTIREQVEQIGNGVAWQMAAALGRSLSRAWTTSVLEGRALNPQEFRYERVFPTVEYNDMRDTVNGFSADEGAVTVSQLVRATSLLGSQVSDGQDGLGIPKPQNGTKATFATEITCP